jgi:hypothetical protein
MAELSWPASEVMQDHLQNLVSQGYMITEELATCCVAEDPRSLIPVRGYVVACVAFYEQGFGAPLHQFLRSLMLSYGLGILHMMAFMTLCEAFIGIESHFNLWSYFF